MPALLHPLDNNGVVKIDKPIVFVGRHPECDLVITGSRKVSRKHCCLAEVNGKFLIRDLGSTNGVQVNGDAVTKSRQLNDGDELIIGDVGYRIEVVEIVKRSRPNGKKTDQSLESQTETGQKRVVKIEDDEQSDDVSVVIEEPEEDGFEVFNEPQKRRPSQRKKKKGSGSVPEFVVD